MEATINIPGLTAVNSGSGANAADQESTSKFVEDREHGDERAQSPDPLYKLIQQLASSPQTQIKSEPQASDQIEEGQQKLEKNEPREAKRRVDSAETLDMGVATELNEQLQAEKREDRARVQSEAEAKAKARAMDQFARTQQLQDNGQDDHNMEGDEHLLQPQDQIIGNLDAQAEFFPPFQVPQPQQMRFQFESPFQLPIQLNQSVLLQQFQAEQFRQMQTQQLQQHQIQQLQSQMVQLQQSNAHQLQQNQEQAQLIRIQQEKVQELQKLSRLPPNSAPTGPKVKIIDGAPTGAKVKIIDGAPTGPKVQVHPDQQSQVTPLRSESSLNPVEVNRTSRLTPLALSSPTDEIVTTSTLASSSSPHFKRLDSNGPMVLTCLGYQFPNNDVRETPNTLSNKDRIQGPINKIGKTLATAPNIKSTSQTKEPNPKLVDHAKDSSSKLKINYHHNYYIDLGVQAASNVRVDSLQRAYDNNFRTFSPTSKHISAVRNWSSNNPMDRKRVREGWERIEMARKVLLNPAMKVLYDSKRPVFGANNAPIPDQLRSGRHSKGRSSGCSSGIDPSRQIPRAEATERISTSSHYRGRSDVVGLEGASLVKKRKEARSPSENRKRVKHEEGGDINLSARPKAYPPPVFTESKNPSQVSIAEEKRVGRDDRDPFLAMSVDAEVHRIRQDDREKMMVMQREIEDLKRERDSRAWKHSLPALKYTDSYKPVDSDKPSSDSSRKRRTD